MVLRILAEAQHTIKGLETTPPKAGDWQSAFEFRDINKCSSLVYGREVQGGYRLMIAYVLYHFWTGREQ